MTTTSKSSLPDVASESQPEIGGKIDQVGMAGIETVIRFHTTGDQLITMPGTADISVNLQDERAKGIHMSRLYLALQEQLSVQELTSSSLRELLTTVLETHADLSSSAYLGIEFRLPLKQMALKSEISGWRHYPVRVEASCVDGKMEVRAGVRVTYSSTCPCSASLSRNLLSKKFESDFESHRWLSVSSMISWIEENGSLATPHSQRSFVDATVRFTNELPQLPIELLISEIETTLNTPVQAAVKRADEQEFARLNGSNLMFCEDAARALTRTLSELSIIEGYFIEVNHMESLHPHDAVSTHASQLDRGVRFRKDRT